MVLSSQSFSDPTSEVVVLIYPPQRLFIVYLERFKKITTVENTVKLINQEHLVAQLMQGVRTNSLVDEYICVHVCLVEPIT